MANERSELILRVDDLTHKVLRCESEVAVGETFDLVFFGGRVWDGDSAKVFLYDDKERLLWSASGVVEARSDGAFVISGCVIDTEQAAAYANRGDKRGRRVYGELIRVDVEGERTDYGDFSFLLHKGVSADGTPLVKFLDDLSAHNVDGEAHEDIRQEIAQVETSILASVSQDLEEHSVVEETARNEAIHRAMIDLRSELEGGADGIGAGAVAEATRQAALAGEIAVGVADSARAAAVSAETAAQAAKDGASYLNLIINASKSALASKDQAQAFATSSSEAKEAAEASVASVNSDRTAVEAARDDVLEARNDVISAQGAVGGLLSSVRESEEAARKGASTASRAASDAESAKSAAESARDRAVVARDDAEAFAAGAARSAEASDASAVRSEKAAAQSAQAAAEGVTALLQGKVDAAEAAKAGAESAKTAAETAQGKAEDAQKAATSSATAAANSATAAAQSATDLAEAVTTAESLDGRIDALEAGTGAYIIQSRDVIPYGKPTSADVGKVIYFDHFASETTSTLAVTNSTPWAQKVCPAPIVANGAGLCAVGCFDYTKNKKYIVFMTAIVINPIGYLYELNVGDNSSTLTFKSKLATSYFSDETVGASYWCRNICVHDGFVFYTRRHYDGGPYLTVCEVDTGKLITNIDLDPKNTGGIYVNSAIWYNPLSGHICVLCYAFSLPSGETWGGANNSNGNTHFVRVFSWDSETKTLSDIPDGDSPATVIDVTDAFTEAGATGVINDRAYGSTWPIRDQVFVSIQGSSYMALFHATADDRIEPCYEWDVEYETGEDGITRPVWETQPEEWTDSAGNTQTIQNYVRDTQWDLMIIPKMTKGRLLKFMCAADYDGVPSGVWCSNPVFSQGLNGYTYSDEDDRGDVQGNYSVSQAHIMLTDGVVKWRLTGGYRFIRVEAMTKWNVIKYPAWNSGLERAPIRDETTGVYLLNDVRKGATRKYTGWLPKSGQYITNVGSSWGWGYTDVCLLTPLTAAQSGTPLSRIGMVSNAGTDSAAMTPLPITATYSKDWWIASMLPYCQWGFFGNVWATTYKQTIGGVL